MKESKLYSEFQRLGKVLMAPVLLLPVSGILVGLGSALSNANLISLCPLLGTEPMVIFSTLIKAAGNVINGNISVLFAICIAYGYAKAEKATAALSGFIGYMTMNTIMGQLLILLGTIDPANLQTGQNAILGVTTLDTGVFGGIIIGLVVAWIHNRFYKVQLPPVLGIFNGTRCVPALTVARRPNTRLAAPKESSEHVMYLLIHPKTAQVGARLKDWTPTCINLDCVFESFTPYPAARASGLRS